MAFMQPSTQLKQDLLTNSFTGTDYILHVLNNWHQMHPHINKMTTASCMPIL